MLAEYPGYYCYDANRPSWVPYWWDTWTESTCKLKAVPGNIASCLNPLSTQCEEPINTDPTVSGGGIVGHDGEGSNTPKESMEAIGLYATLAVLGLVLFLNK